MKRNDLIGGIFFLAMGALFAVYSRTVDIGSWDEPGPGFLPFHAGLLLAGMSVALIAKTLLRKVAAAVKAEPFFAERDSWKRVLQTLLALVAYNLLLKPLGFVLVTFLFVGFLVKCIFPQSWSRSVLAATLSTAGAWFVFARLLEITFPRGIIGL